MDISFMRLALLEGKKGRYTSPSNPWVGCVIVDQGQIVATGYHRRRGDLHAERVALNSLKDTILTDATLYCTLEPCCHNGLTPPCVEEIIRRQIKRVVIGVIDPDHRVRGQGIKVLKEAGIKVEILNDPEVSKSLRSYLFHRQYKRPYVVVKMAISLDGMISFPGDATTITGPLSRQEVQRLRLKSQAILIGSNTALTDNPQLTLRLDESHPHYTDGQVIKRTRVILDGRGRLGLPENREKITHLWKTDVAPTLIIMAKGKCSPDSEQWFKSHGIQVETVPVCSDGTLSEESILDILGRRNILYLLIEGGSQVVTSFMMKGLVNKLVLHQAPIVLGSQGIPAFPPGIRLGSPVKVKIVGNDLHTVYRFN